MSDSPAAVLHNVSGTEVGTNSNPLRTDPTGTTTQPVSSAAATQVDGHSASIGSTTDAETALTVIGRLKKLISLIAGGLPTTLVGGRLDTNTGSWLGSTAPTVGQKVMATSLPIVVASDQSSIPTLLSSGNNVVGKVKLVDTSSLALDVELDTAVPTNTRGIMSVGEDANGVARALQVRVDAIDNTRRLQIEGKVSITAPQPPPATTAITIDSSSPLAISSTQTVNYIITAGKRFMIQQVVAGCEGDTSERGSCVEVFYFDGTTAHIIERVYLNGFTTETYPAASKSRDNTNLDGNGSTKTIRIVRRRLSGSSQEVDATVRGYEFTP